MTLGAWAKFAGTTAVKFLNQLMAVAVVPRVVTLLVAVPVVLLLVGVYLHLAFRIDLPERMWASRIVDQILFLLVFGCGALVVAFGVGLITPLRRHLGWQAFWRPAWGFVGGLVLLVGVYVAYAALRNQARLTAEVALNVAGSELLKFEMEDHGLRCIYDNYVVEDHDACLRAIVSNDASWSKALFYVEESWFVIEKAVRDRHDWGSEYATEIRYWAQDISRDPSGIFGFYVVANEGSVCEARNRIIKSGTCIPDLCKSYTHVATALAAAGRPARDRLCATPAEIAVGRIRCDEQQRPVAHQGLACSAK